MNKRTFEPKKLWNEQRQKTKTKDVRQKIKDVKRIEIGVELRFLN